VVTFNEILCVHGVNPNQVTMLRHTGGKKQLGVSPFDLWQRRDGSFELYQCTQSPKKSGLFESPYWACFVSNPANETLFVGLYGAVKGDQKAINWPCPMTGLSPGEDAGIPSEFYHLNLQDNLVEHRGSLKIDWGRGNIAWARHARRKNHAVIGDVNLQQAQQFEESAEGEATWRTQKVVERDSRLARNLLKKNAEANDGLYACEACDFRHSDRAMFDAHHPHPLLSGPRMTKASDLTVLCPVCHRRAHRSTNRLIPFSLNELQAWNEAGRP
jgi:hypothetical protein